MLRQAVYEQLCEAVLVQMYPEVNMQVYKLASWYDPLLA